MRRSWPRALHWSWSRAFGPLVVVSALSALAISLPAADGAAAAAAGYTASYVRTGSAIVLAEAVNPATDTIYVSTASDQLIAIDGSSNAVLGTVTLPGLSRGIAVDSATNTIYVALTTPTDEVAVIDGATDSTEASIPLPSGADPFAIAVDEAAARVYVTDFTQGSVFVIDGTSNTLLATVSSAGSEPVAIAVDDSTHVVWVANESGAVTAISGVSDSITSSVSVTGRPVQLAVNPVTDTVYVAAVAGGLAVINGSAGTLTTTVSLSPIQSVAVDPTANLVYASGLPVNSVGETSVIDGTSNTVIDTIAAGGDRAAENTTTGSVYVSTSSSVYAGVWAITASASNAVSPIIVSESGTLTAGVAGSVTPAIYGQPAPTVTEAGGLPAGVTLSTSGTLSGTPATGTGGQYPITLTASNGVAPDYSVVFTLDVDEGPSITSPARTTFYAGVPSPQFVVTASGYPPPTFSETGALPPGISMDYSVMEGTPAAGSAGRYPIEVTASNGLGTATQAFTLDIDGGSSFVPVNPVRVLDTRDGTGTGGTIAPVGPGGTLQVQVTGVDGVPPFWVTAVVLNVTAVNPTASSFVTVYPAFELRPVASNLNINAGQTISNLVTVPVGMGNTGGTSGVEFYNNSGSTDLVADVAGYYTTDDYTFNGHDNIVTGSSFVPAGPSRVLDTRSGTGVPQAPVGPGGTVSLQVTGSNGVPATGVTSVALNVTATDTTAASYVTVYPDGETRPLASNLNFTAGQTIPNLVVVPVGADGKIDLYNNAGSTDLVADLAGYYLASASTSSGSSFVALGPSRVLDTRNGTGGTTTPVGPGGNIGLRLTGTGGVPATGVTAVVLNVTATDTTAASYVTVYPDGQPRPTASNLNFSAGETIPNLVVVPVGPDGIIDFYNHVGNTDLVADLEGYYTSP